MLWDCAGAPANTTALTSIANILYSAGIILNLLLVFLPKLLGVFSTLLGTG
jgi:hypothetical protein